MKIEQAIQVSVSLTDNKARDREIEALIDAEKELGVKDLFILTEDEEGDIKVDSIEIKIIPTWKWLLL